MTDRSGAAEQAHIPISVDLLSRRSLVGSVVVLGIALVYALVFPIVYETMRTEGFSPGQPYTIEQGFEATGKLLEITPAEGWALDPESGDFLTTLTHGASTLQIVGPAQAYSTAEESMRTTASIYEQRTDGHWQTGGVQTFVTESGEHGASLIAHSTSSVEAAWVLVVGDVSVTVAGLSTDNDWVSVADEMAAMARSMRIVEGSAG